MEEEYRRNGETARGSADKPTFWVAPDLAKQGYPVFPIGQNKQPSVEGGFYAATTDISQIAEWIEEGRGDHDVAFATGLPSGVVVVDADTTETYAWMLRRCGEPNVKTKRGGHWYFRHPRDGKVTSTDLWAGLDCKGDGGYVLAPPSLGRTWTDGIPERAVLPKLPDKLRPKAPANSAGGSNGSADQVGDAIPDGARNKTLASLGGSMRRRGMGGAEIEAALLVTNEQRCKPPLPAEEVAKIAASVARYEPAANGSATATRPADGEHPGEGKDGGTTRTAEQAEPEFRLTDWGNAQRFVRDHGKDVRYCYPWRKWLVWDDKRWRVDDSGEVERLMKATMRGIYTEAAAEENDETSKALANHARKSQSKTHITDALYLARSEPGIAILPDQLDADPWALNALNGTIDLRTGERREHSREDLITKIASDGYDPEAEAPIFERFLERILPSEAVRGFLQRAVGYAAVGLVREEVLPILHGHGANGKTTLTGVLMEALGDYATQAPPDLLMQKKGAHPTELADLFGKRFVVCMENEEGRRLAESLVKHITGRDRVKARRMREDFWEFKPSHTVFLGTNHRPEIRGTDHAIWRRPKLVPFDVTIPEAEQDKKLSEKLRAELPGVLAWIVRGCLEYQRDGLGEPDQVKDATERYKTAMDALAAFFAERCVIHKDATAPATPLYKAYQEWCADNGEKDESQRRFGERLRERGYEGFTYTSGAYKDRKGWKGIGLRDDRPDGGPEGGPGAGENPPDSQPTADVQTQTSDANHTQDAYNAQKTGDKGPLSGQSAAKVRSGERGLGKGQSHDGGVHSGQSGPFFGVNSSETSRGVVNPEKGQQGQQGPRAGDSGSWVGDPDDPERGYRDAAEMLEDPPPWLATQLQRARTKPGLLKPTAHTVSSEVYGTYERWPEVLPLLQQYLDDDYEDIV